MYMCVFVWYMCYSDVFMHVSECVFMWMAWVHLCTCIHVFVSMDICLPQHTCGSQKVTLGISPCLLLYCKQNLFVVRCCIIQASWPASFQSISCLCLLPHHSNTVLWCVSSQIALYESLGSQLRSVCSWQTLHPGLSLQASHHICLCLLF